MANQLYLYIFLLCNNIHLPLSPCLYFLTAVNVVQRLSLVLVYSYCVFLSSLPACSSSYLLDMILSHCLDCNIYHVISALWKLIHPWL